MVVRGRPSDVIPSDSTDLDVIAKAREWVKEHLSTSSRIICGIVDAHHGSSTRCFGISDCPRRI
ncbi:glutamate-ammonia-ligase adenylyltransferase [Cutibacterium acnes JCM 18918]|nr:glutamate-ammonia-ligase adenylyltransferase [Cutibacterium acnes JCM 18918]